MYVGKRTGEGEGLARSIIFYFSDVIFFSKYAPERLGTKKVSLFQRT